MVYGLGLQRFGACRLGLVVWVSTGICLYRVGFLASGRSGLSLESVVCNSGHTVHGWTRVSDVLIPTSSS